MANSNSDGSIILSVTIDTEGLQSEISKLNSTLEKGIKGFSDIDKSVSNVNNTTNVFNNTINNSNTSIVRMASSINQNVTQINTFQNAARRATSSLRNLATQLGLVFSLRQLVQFSKEASDLSSQTEASIKRVTILYGEATETVKNFIDNNSYALGMSKASAYQAASDYGNLFKTFTDGANSAKLTNAMLQTTAIIASQTGRTYEEVFEKIRSGLYGNTRAIDDLGISVRQVKLEQTEAFQTVTGGVKKWNDLTDAELQAARALGIIEQSHILYGNTVLQSTSLTRSQFNAAWNDFKATWGVAVNKVLMPILKWLTMILRYAQILLRVLFDLDLSANVASSIDYSGISTDIGKVSNSQKNMAKSTKKLKNETKELNKQLAQFDELIILSQKDNKIDDVTTPSSGGVGGEATGGIGDIPLGDIGTILDDDSLKKLQEFETWVTNHKDAIKTALEIAGLGILGSSLANVAKKIGNLLGLFKKKDSALDTQTSKTNAETSAVYDLSYAFSLVPALAYGVAYGLDRLTQGANGTVPALDGVTASAYGTIPALDSATQGAYGVAPALDGVRDSANGTIPALDGAGQSVTNYGTVVDTVMPQTETTAKKALDNTETNASNYSTATKSTFSDWATSVATNVNTVATAIGKGMYESLDSAGKNINSFVETTSQSIKDWSESASKNFVNTAKNIATSMGNALETAWENWKDFKKATGEKISTFWNKHGATITTIAVVGAVTAGAIALAPYTGGVSLAAVGLANGAVLPPNQPFLAVVGDQKSGTNIEAPLKTIEQALENVLIRANVESTERSTPTTVVLQVNDREFGRAVVDLGNKENRIRGNSFVKTKLIYG